MAAARRKDDEEGAVAAAHVGAAEVGLERRGADELEPLDAEAVGGGEERQGELLLDLRRVAVEVLLRSFVSRRDGHGCG